MENAIKVLRWAAVPAALLAAVFVARLVLLLIGTRIPVSLASFGLAFIGMCYVLTATCGAYFFAPTHKRVTLRVMFAISFLIFSAVIFLFVLGPSTWQRILSWVLFLLMSGIPAYLLDRKSGGA